MKRSLKILFALFVVSQFIQPDRTPPKSDPAHDLIAIARPSPAVEKLLRSACYDCHSNATRYPWYAYITPVNWWIQKKHVEHGRHHVNFNEWGKMGAKERSEVLEHAPDMISGRDMPLPSYTWLHADARLSDAQRLMLIDFFSSLNSDLPLGHYVPGP